MNLRENSESDKPQIFKGQDKKKGKKCRKKGGMEKCLQQNFGRFYEYSGQSMSMGQLERDGCVHICVPGEE